MIGCTRYGQVIAATMHWSQQGGWSVGICAEGQDIVVAFMAEVCTIAEASCYCESRWVFEQF